MLRWRLFYDPENWPPSTNDAIGWERSHATRTLFPPPGTMFQQPGTMFPPIKAGQVQEQVSDDDNGNGVSS